MDINGRSPCRFVVHQIDSVARIRGPALDPFQIFGRQRDSVSDDVRPFLRRENHVEWGGVIGPAPKSFLLSDGVGSASAFNGKPASTVKDDLDIRADHARGRCAGDGICASVVEGDDVVG